MDVLGVVVPWGRICTAAVTEETQQLPECIKSVQKTKTKTWIKNGDKIIAETKQ